MVAAFDTTRSLWYYLLGLRGPHSTTFWDYEVLVVPTFGTMRFLWYHLLGLRDPYGTTFWDYKVFVVAPYCISRSLWYFEVLMVLEGLYGTIRSLLYDKVPLIPQDSCGTVRLYLFGSLRTRGLKKENIFQIKKKTKKTTGPVSESKSS